MLFFTTHDKVGGWGVCLGIFFALTFTSLLQQNYFGKLKPLMARQKLIAEKHFYGSLPGNLITTKQIMRIQITPLGALTCLRH